MPASRRASIFHRDSAPREREQLREELARTRVLLQQAYGSFNLVKDQDLIESYVFEIKALEARYSYLLRQFKALEAVG